MRRTLRFPGVSSVERRVQRPTRSVTFGPSPSKAATSALFPFAAPGDGRLDRARSASLVDALLLLASSADLELRRTEVERQVARAGARGRDVVASVACAGEELGLRMHVLPLTLGELVAGSGPAASGLLPALLFPPASAPPRAPLAVVGVKRDQLALVDAGSDAPPRYVSLAALATELGIGAAGVVAADLPARLVLADPKRGLDALEGRGGGGGGGEGAEATPERRLLELLRLERDDAWVAVVYAAAVGVLSIATPLGVQFLVNTVAFGALVQPLVVLTLLVAAGLVFAGLLRALQAWVVERLQQRLFARVALDLAHRLPRVRVEALDTQHGPELVNRFFDVVTVQKGAATMLVDGTSVVLQTLVGLVLLAFYHPYLFAFDAFLLLALAVITFVLGRGAVSSAVKESKLKFDLAAWLQETIRHPHAFKLQDGQEHARIRAETLTREWVQARRKHFGVVFRQYVGALVVQAIASAVLLGVGGALVIGGKLTLGQLVAAELIVTSVVVGFSKLGKYFETYYDLAAAIDKIGTLVDLPTEGAGSVDLPHAEVGLDIRATGIAIRRQDREVLRDVSLHVRPGSRVAVFAQNGQGKSCLVDVLVGLRETSSGRLDLDGIDVRELSPSSLRKHVAVIRDAEIFSGTIAENIQLGRPDVSRHDMRCALEALGAWDFVTALPEGLDTPIATRGVGLPSGFVTMLLVARAVVGRPRAIVLDGVLDTLAPGAREALKSAIASLGSRATVVVATVDPDVVSWCDEGYVLAEGTLEAAQ